MNKQKQTKTIRPKYLCIFSIIAIFFFISSCAKETKNTTNNNTTNEEKSTTSKQTPNQMQNANQKTTPETQELLDTLENAHGIATMKPGGTIELIFSLSDKEQTFIGDGREALKPNSNAYQHILKKLGGLKIGETKKILGKNYPKELLE